MKKPTLVIGVSQRPERYAYKAVVSLVKAGHPVYAFGIGTGTVEGVKIQNSFPENAEIDTVTLYIRPERQREYYDDILKLRPKRVIFNPGTENPEFEKLLKKNNIETVEGCTLVMLATNSY